MEHTRTSDEASTGGKKPKPIISRCSICSRTLTDPNSVSRGIGPVCAAKLAAYVEQVRASPDGADPTQEQVVLWRDGDTAKTNVPHTVIYHSPTGFEWGYGGSGPADLAINIMHLFCPKRYDWQETCPVGISGKPSVQVTSDALRVYQDFKREFIEPMPVEGGIIKAKKIRNWLKRKGILIA